MACVSIPKDLTHIKAKFIFGLTKRQAFCFGMSLVIGLPLFFLLKGVISLSAASLIMIFSMLPWFLLAMYERNGMPLEKFLMCIIRVKFMRPKIRTYQTDNLYAATRRQNQLYKEVRGIVTGKK